MDRRDFLKTIAAGAVSTVTSSGQTLNSGSSTHSDRPNILLVIADQDRAGLTRRNGYPINTSPTLDHLADIGMAFDRAYVTQPVCVPSRTSLLTGRWPHAHRVRQNNGGGQPLFETDAFGVLKSAGYVTGLVGKNHTYLKPEKLDFWREYNDLVGWQPPNAPKEVTDFEDWRRKLNFGVSQVPTPFPLEAQFAYRIIDNAIEFVETFGNRPFVLEVSFPEPHDPEQVPKPYFDMFPPEEVPNREVGPEALKFKGFQWRWMRGLQEHVYPGYDEYWRRYVSNYLGSLRMVDDQLARLLQHLDSKDLLRKTIIVFVSDHGDFVMDYGLMRKGVGLPECLVRVPMVWTGPEIRKGRPAMFVSVADVMPTLCDAIGVDIPKGVQGRSLWPILQGEEYPEEEFRSVYAEGGFGGLYYDESDNVPYSIADFKGLGRYIVPDEDKTFDELNFVTQSGTMKMVRMGEWKLIYDMMGYGQIYNLRSDPNELNNLYNDPSVAKEQTELLAELLMWTIRTQDSLPTGAYKTKWPGAHNWYASHRHGKISGAFVP